MGRINVTSSIFGGLRVPTMGILARHYFGHVSLFIKPMTLDIRMFLPSFGARERCAADFACWWRMLRVMGKLTWLVLGGDPAARSHRVEQFTAL